MDDFTLSLRYTVKGGGERLKSFHSLNKYDI